MSVWNHSEHFAPAVPREARLSLGEGNTALIDSRSIGPAAGFDRLCFKLESSNPTGSYKDRFAAVAVGHMIASAEHTCLATSSGNTGAALAAYCAAAKLRCRIAVVESAPASKLQQMLAYGAEIEKVRGFGLDADVTREVIERIEAKARHPGFALQVSAFRWSPLGMQGVESISFELKKQIPEKAGSVFCPAGGGGLTLAVARGARKAGSNFSIHCVQPEGNDTIAGPLRDGTDKARDVECTSSVSGLQVANVIDGDEVIAACRESGGTGHTVSDGEIYGVQKRLAREEGIFSEPAGAVALAGALQAASNGEIDRSLPVVCLVTGSGFKDPGSVEKMNSSEVCQVVDPGQLFTDR
ncbi:MAG: pyridoxal-phosphate dependent enzyme [Verrucomicrobiales bacterium]